MCMRAAGVMSLTIFITGLAQSAFFIIVCDSYRDYFLAISTMPLLCRQVKRRINVVVG